MTENVEEIMRSIPMNVQGKTNTAWNDYPALPHEKFIVGAVDEVWNFRRANPHATDQDWKSHKHPKNRILGFIMFALALAIMIIPVVVLWILC